MKVAIGCDHGGINLKPALLKHLQEKGVEFIDYGCYDNKSVDYVDYDVKVAKSVQSKECDLGILICGTGIGMSIVANKFKGIRCGHAHDTFSARMTRLHNDANVLAFGERVIGVGLMIDIVDAFLDTPFSNDERHIRRIEKISQVEKDNLK